MEIKERVKILRLLRGRSQPELAAEAGISQAQIASYERGAYKPKSAAVLQMAKALHVSPDYLLYGSPPLSDQYWSVQADTRDHITGKIANDIIDLLPGLLRESKIICAFTAKVKDGLVIFMGRGFVLDIILTVSHPVLADACQQALCLTEIKSSEHDVELDICVSDVAYHLNHFAELSPMRISTDEITQAWKRVKSSIIYVPLTIAEATLALTYKAAVDTHLDPEQFILLTKEISKWPAAQVSVESIKDHIWKVLSKVPQKVPRKEKRG